MIKILAIGLGGFLGAVMRYLISTQIGNWLGRDFPYGTLVVNVSGCLLLGIVYALFHTKYTINDDLLYAIQLGFLGALTTYSTFSIETLLLLQNSEFGKAFINIFSSVILCIFAVWLGITITKVIIR